MVSSPLLASIKNGHVRIKRSPSSPHLVGVTVQIEVLQESGCELAEERVVGFIYGPQTPVRVVIGAGAGTETSHCTNKSKFDYAYCHGLPVCSDSLKALKVSAFFPYGSRRGRSASGRCCG